MRFFTLSIIFCGKITNAPKIYSIVDNNIVIKAHLKCVSITQITGIHVR